GPHRVHTPPVALRLRIHLGIAIDFRRGCQDKHRPFGLGHAQSVVGAESTHLERVDGMPEIVLWAGRTGEVQNRLEGTVHIERFGDVALDEMKRGVEEQVGDILLPASLEVVHRGHRVALDYEPVAEVGTYESGSAGYEYSHTVVNSLETARGV